MMIQALLVDRLHFAVHRELKNLEVLSLVTAKSGLKLRLSAGTADPQCRFTGRGDPTDSMPSLRQWTCQNVTMEFLARSLSVVDSTGLQGSYDVAFQWMSPNINYGSQLTGEIADARVAGL
jgi:uncharacterized protein (TIGR03435 family)